MERRGHKRYQISRNKDITTLLFADNQVTVADSEGALQTSTHKLEINYLQICTKNLHPLPPKKVF
jgi:hypothetical protein